MFYVKYLKVDYYEYNFRLTLRYRAPRPALSISIAGGPREITTSQPTYTIAPTLLVITQLFPGLTLTFIVFPRFFYIYSLYLTLISKLKFGSEF